MDRFWFFMLAMVILIPLIMIIFGSVFIKRPPRKINKLFGYRSYRSMQSDENWRFAHKLIGKIWLILGAVSLILSVALYVGLLNLSMGNDKITSIIGGSLLCAQAAAITISIIPVESALKKFDKNKNNP